MNNVYISDWHDDILERLFHQEEFIQDARSMASIPNDVFENALEAVESASGFLGPRQLAQILAAHVSDASQRMALTRFLVNLGRLRREMRDEPKAFAEQAAATLSNVASNILTAEELDALSPRVQRVVQPKQAIERHAKAEQVVRRAGRTLDSIALVCDLRPIFDEARERVDGMIPVTTMKVVVSTPESLPTSIECRLTEKQVHELQEEVEHARRKLETLKRLLGEKGITLPESFMTVVSDDTTS